MSRAIFYCPTCDDFMIDFVYDDIAQTLDDAKALHGEMVGMHGPGSLVNLMDVYLAAKELGEYAGSNTFTLTTTDTFAPLALWRALFAALEAEA